MFENAPALVRSLTTFGIRNAELLIAEIRTYRGNDTDVSEAHADDGTVVRLYGRSAPVESIHNTDISVMFPGTRADVFTYMLSVSCHLAGHIRNR